MNVSATKIEAYLFEVEKYLWKKEGMQATERMLYPLKWWIATGRASSDFLRAMLSAKPFVIGRLLQKAGTVDETVERIHERLNVERFA